MVRLIPDAGTQAASAGGRSERNRTRGGTLSRERIVRAALDIVDRDGPKALSMRRLGAELGVDPMAAYYHIPNKEALLDAIVEAVMAEIDLGGDDPSAPLEERIVHAARAYRDVLLAHVNALPIVLTRGPSTPVALRPVEFLIGLLREAGLSPSQSLAGMNAIAATVRGTVGMVADRSALAKEEMAKGLDPDMPDRCPHLLEAMACSQDFLGRDFEFGIRALARGLLAEGHS